MADQEPQYIKSLDELSSHSSAHKYLILDFTAAWCPPCKAIAPLFTKLSKEYTSPALGFYKVDVDEAPEVASKFQVTAMPTFLVLTDGEAKGVPVPADAVTGGGVVAAEGGSGIWGIRGADAKNLVALSKEVAVLAKKEGGEGDDEPTA